MLSTAISRKSDPTPPNAISRPRVASNSALIAARASGAACAIRAPMAPIFLRVGRIATSAIRHRDREPGHRAWIAIYGGALHTDRFPEPSVAEWSYAVRAQNVIHRLGGATEQSRSLLHTQDFFLRFFLRFFLHLFLCHGVPFISKPEPA